MSIAAAIEWGSVADWVSGIGSISAALIALWLSGSERRAQKEADRPIVSCRFEGILEGWVKLFIAFDNPSSKQWRCLRATVTQPRDGLVVRASDTMKTVGIDRKFDLGARTLHAAKSIKLPITVGAVGSQKASFQGGGRGNYTWERVHVFHGSSDRFALRLEFESLEPIPDRFSVTIKREVLDEAETS